jgi:hypothetical protein
MDQGQGKNPSLVAVQSPRHNRLLAALPVADYERLLPHLDLVPMELGRAIYESGSQQGYVYFPTFRVSARIVSHFRPCGNECVVPHWQNPVLA